MIRGEWKGLDELQRNLRKLENRARELDGTHSVPLNELLHPGFVRAHIRGCSSLEDWLQKSGFRIEAAEDFKAIPDGDWDACVRSSTSFSSWEEMLNAAGAEMVKRKLFE